SGLIRIGSPGRARRRLAARLERPRKRGQRGGVGDRFDRPGLGEPPAVAVVAALERRMEDPVPAPYGGLSGAERIPGGADARIERPERGIPEEEVAHR